MKTIFKDFKNFENNIANEKLFFIDESNSKFKLCLGDIVVSESNFSIEQPDEWFNEKYVTLFDLKTTEEFRSKGFAKLLLEQIFDYVKNTLKINIITLIVYKTNHKAINLYLNSGFEKYIDYDDKKDNNNSHFTFVKKLSDTITIEPISCELSENMKSHIEMLKWTENAFYEYATKVLMISKKDFGNNNNIK